MRSTFLAVLAALALAQTAGAAAYDIDTNHAAATFSVKHLMVTNVRGELSNITGKVNLDDKDLTKSSVEATIDATTINTRNERRDGHLKSPDFLDVTKFPTLTFKSTKVEKISDSHLKVAGDLTIHGITKPVMLDVELSDKEIKDLAGNMVRAVNAATKINRKEFGLNWNKALEGGGVLVGDDVVITIDAELTRKGAGKSM